MNALGLEHLKNWIAEYSQKPDFMGEVNTSELPHCPSCGEQMLLKHSSRDNRWAIRHPLFTNCSERTAPGLWKEDEKEALQAYLDAPKGRYAPNQEMIAMQQRQIAYMLENRQ